MRGSTWWRSRRCCDARPIFTARPVRTCWPPSRPPTCTTAMAGSRGCEPRGARGPSSRRATQIASMPGRASQAPRRSASNSSGRSPASAGLPCSPAAGSSSAPSLDRAVPPPRPRPRGHAEFGHRLLRPRRHCPPQAIGEAVMKRALRLSNPFLRLPDPEAMNASAMPRSCRGERGGHGCAAAHRSNAGAPPQAVGVQPCRGSPGKPVASGTRSSDAFSRSAGRARPRPSRRPPWRRRRAAARGGCRAPSRRGGRAARRGA